MALLLLAALPGCEPVPGEEGPSGAAGDAQRLSLRPVDYASLPGWQSDRLSVMRPSLLAQCQRLATLPPEARLGGQTDSLPQGTRPADWRAFCGALQWIGPGDEAGLRRTIEAWLQPYAIGDGGRETAHLGGYFDPEFPGALSRDAMHDVPVYRRPPDLISERPSVSGRAEGVTGRLQATGTLVPYWTRAQIDAGALAGRGLELVWLESQADLFSLQLQGSGRVRLPSGQIVRLGFDGTNGAAYVPLGQVLVRDGEMTPGDVSLASIRAWLLAHPAQGRPVIEQNPNYAFFRVLDRLRPDEGPVGALQLDLSPLRSLAVDRSFLPLAAPVWVDTTLPDGTRLQRLMLAQDLGTDLARPAQADLFFGWGEQAGQLAGAMHDRGRMTILLPRPPRS